MRHPKKSTNIKLKRYRPLLVTAFLASNIFQAVAPVLAEGTAGGTSINNTATSTYEDPNNPGTTINATSNTVTVTVAKVAGVTVTGSGVTDKTNPGGQVKDGDQLYYTYTVTNVGNNPGKFRVPNLVTVTGPGTAGTVQINYDDSNPNGWTDISGSEVVTKELAAGSSFLVRVPVTVTSNATQSDTISVQLGKTPSDAQNQLRSADGGDVYTVDSNDNSLPGEVAGTSINGVREASATQQIKVGNAATSTALATILNTRTGFDSSNSTDKLNNDVLTYGLSLRVESTDVTNTGQKPAPLAGTSITVDGKTETHIIVSDAIPANTVLNGTPTAPTGWKVIYTTDPTTSKNANAATWVTTEPTSGVTRVGFINDPTVITSVSPGQTVTGFTIQVKTQGISGTTIIATIAQVFGTTSGGDPNKLVYDDSGDQNPDDYHGSNPPSGTISNGVANPNTDPKDTNNNNTATTTVGGADNVYTISAPSATSVLNGPLNAPDATGPNSNNDDFTNKSASIPSNIAPGSLLPNAVSVGFNNTVKNTGQSTVTIDISPTIPAVPSDLPNNTTVTLTYGSLSATYTYTYDATNKGSFTLAANGKTVQIDGVASGATANYGVEVKLPAGATLSTDTGKGFPVMINAFIDGTPTASNTTIDRVYTGFLKMLKESRILQGTGSAPQSADGNFSITPKNPARGNIIEYRITYTNISDKQVGTGNILLNANKLVITEDGTTFNAASNKNGNSWALDNDKNNVIDTSNIVGSAKDSGTSTITFFKGNPANTSSGDQTGTTVETDVTKYIDTVTDQVAPQQERTFGFQRKVN